MKHFISVQQSHDTRPSAFFLLFAVAAAMFLLTSISVFAAPLWSGNSQLSFLQTAGNTQVRTLGTGSELSYNPREWDVGFKGNYTNGVAQGVSVANSLNLDLRGARKLSEPLEAFVQVAFLRNPFNSFNARVAADLGLGYLVVRGDKHNLRTDFGGGVAKEDRTTGAQNTFATLNFTAKYRWKISETAEIQDTLAVIYSIRDSRDWRYKNELAVLSSLTSIFSLKLGYQMVQLNLPAPGFRKLDTQTTVAIVAKY
jgi:putative salt-induced outer membrane protein YdiY